MKIYIYNIKHLTLYYLKINSYHVIYELCKSRKIYILIPITNYVLDNWEFFYSSTSIV